MVDDTDRLMLLGVDPDALEQAPGGPLRHSGYHPRINPGPGRRACAGCGRPAVATARVTVPGLGLRWLDTCRDCMLASRRDVA